MYKGEVINIYMIIKVINKNKPSDKAIQDVANELKSIFDKHDIRTYNRSKIGEGSIWNEL
jgi:hypothetical protein